MSGVLLLAARHGIAGLVAEEGLAGYLTKNHSCGLTLNPESQSSIAAALERVAREPKDLAAAGERGKIASARHTIEEFQKEIAAFVTSTIGMAERRSECA